MDIVRIDNKCFLFVKKCKSVSYSLFKTKLSKQLENASNKIYNFFHFQTLTDDFELVSENEFKAKCVCFDNHSFYVITPCVDLFEHD